MLSQDCEVWRVLTTTKCNKAPGGPDRDALERDGALRRVAGVAREAVYCPLQMPGWGGGAVGEREGAAGPWAWLTGAAPPPFPFCSAPCGPDREH